MRGSKTSVSAKQTTFDLTVNAFSVIFLVFLLIKPASADEKAAHHLILSESKTI
jgi:hypothetical protein